MKVHQSRDLYMRGAGIGNIFTNIFRGVLPLVKSLFGVGAKAIKSSAGQTIIREAKRSALKAGLNVAADALSGQNIPKSLKHNVKHAGRKVVKSLSRPPPTKKSTKSKASGKKRRKKTTISRRAPDLFE